MFTADEKMALRHITKSKTPAQMEFIANNDDLARTEIEAFIDNAGVEIANAEIALIQETSQNEMQILQLTAKTKDIELRRKSIDEVKELIARLKDLRKKVK